MAESSTDLYLQRLAAEVEPDFLRIEGDFRLSLSCWPLVLSAIPAFAMLSAEPLQSVPFAFLLFVALLLSGPLVGGYYGDHWWKTHANQVFLQKVNRARRILLDCGILRILIENQPGHTLEFLEPVLALGGKLNPALQGRQAPDSMEKRLQSLIVNWDTVLARIPLRTYRPIIQGSAADTEETPTGLPLGLITGGLEQALKRTALQAALVLELGSLKGRQALPEFLLEQAGDTVAEDKQG